MKNKIITLMIGSFIIVGSIFISLKKCNKLIIDTTYNFDYAIIALPNGEIVEGKVESWTDYEDGEQLQVKIDGIVYLTSSYNCTLIKK